MNKTASFGLVVVFVGLAATACERTVDTSNVQALAADTSAKNYALVFTGSIDGIPGVTQDPGNIKQVFGDASLGLGFIYQGDTSRQKTPPAPGDTIVKEATTRQILDKSAEIAKQMLDEEKATGKKGTMFWYLSSHGGQGGELISSDGCFYFSQVAKAIRDARGGVPLKRLVVFIDVCFAGQTVNGSQKIDKKSADKATACDSSGVGGLPPGVNIGLAESVEFGLTGNDAAVRGEVKKRLGAANLVSGRTYTDSAAMLTSSMAAFDAMAVNGTLRRGGMGLQGTREQGDLYEEGFFGASSALSETSGDVPSGGAGTIAYIGAFKTLFQSKRATATFADIASSTRPGGQTPQFNYDPPTLQNELVFEPGGGGGKVDPVTPPPAGPTPPVNPTPPAPVNPTPPIPSGGNGDLMTQLLQILGQLGGGGGMDGLGDLGGLDEGP